MSIGPVSSVHGIPAVGPDKSCQREMNCLLQKTPQNFMCSSLNGYGAGGTGVELVDFKVLRE